MRRWLIDLATVYAGSTCGGLLAILLVAAVLRPVNADLVASDGAFSWLPWALCIGAGFGAAAALAAFKRSRAVWIGGVLIVLGSLAALLSLQYKDSGALILLAPAVALAIVRVLEHEGALAPESAGSGVP